MVLEVAADLDVVEGEAARDLAPRTSKGSWASWTVMCLNWRSGASSISVGPVGTGLVAHGAASFASAPPRSFEAHEPAALAVRIDEAAAVPAGAGRGAARRHRPAPASRANRPNWSGGAGTSSRSAQAAGRRPSSRGRASRRAPRRRAAPSRRAPRDGARARPSRPRPTPRGRTARLRGTGRAPPRQRPRAGLRRSAPRPCPPARCRSRGRASSSSASGAPVAGDRLVHRPSNATAPSCSSTRAVAEPLDRGRVVRDEQDRAAALLERGDDAEALSLEALVADREDLVEEQDVRLEERGDREAEPHRHPRRVRPHRPVDRVLELGERDDLVEALADLARGADPGARRSARRSRAR